MDGEHMGQFCWLITILMPQACPVCGPRVRSVGHKREAGWAVVPPLKQHEILLLAYRNVGTACFGYNRKVACWPHVIAIGAKAFGIANSIPVWPVRERLKL